MSTHEARSEGIGTLALTVAIVLVMLLALVSTPQFLTKTASADQHQLTAATEQVS